MPTSTVILHGWSDCSDSFVEMRKFLSKAGVTPISEIYYADYESREDHITFDNVIDGLNDEFHRRPYHQNSGTPPHHAHDHGVPRPTPRGNAVARMELMRNPGRGAPASTVPHCAGAPCGLRDGADMHRYSDF